MPAGGALLEAPAAADTLRGIVEVVGSEPATSVALLMDGGAPPVTLDGERPMLDRLAGLEVAVWGSLVRPGVFRVERVAVRAAGGVAAVDGVLVHDAGGWALTTEDGRRLPVLYLPDALRGMAGARIWLAGPLDRAPDSSGVIKRP
jgi:hypothetical protein